MITAVEALPRSPQRRTVLPGLIDAHLHLTSYAESLMDLDLTNLDGPAILAAIAAEDTKAAGGQWIRARHVAASSWSAIADRRVLDRVTRRPLALWATDLHRLALNTTALSQLGVDASPTPPGGTIVRDSHGFATGALEERAAEEAARRIPPPSGDQIRHAIGLAIRKCQAVGLVGAASYETPSGLEHLTAYGTDPTFALRLFQYGQDLAPADRPGNIAPGLPIIGAKFFLDGTLGSRTAWMKEPFSDRGGCGTCRMLPDAISVVAGLRARGYVVSLHAIGDAAFAAALTLLQGQPGRVEHIQVIDPVDLDRVSPHLIASVQPAHLVGDRHEAASAWGERIRHAYPYRSLWERGATLVFGSDAPVVSPDPLVGLQMAIDRRLGDEAAFGPEQALPLEVALAAYTSGPARTLGIGLGQIAPGAPATLTVVDGDFSRRSERRTATVAATVVAGEIVYGQLV